MELRFNCSICPSFASLNCGLKVRHIGSVHAWEPHFRVTCGIDGCIQTYTSYRRYREHIVNKHSELLSNESVGTQDTHEPSSHSIQELDSAPFNEPVTEVVT